MSYVYRFDNSEKEVIYIGRTVDIRNRIDRNHLSGNSHLPERAIREINKIYIASLNNNDEAIIYENYLINTLNPKYNSQNKNNSKFSFKLPDVEWVLYKTIGNHDKKREGSINKVEDNCWRTRDNIMALYKEIGIDSEEKILIFNAVKFAILEGVDIFVKPKYGAIASFNPYTLQCLGIYDSTRVAMEDTGIHMSSINRAARKGALSGGMLWMYVRDMKERESDKSLREFYI